MTDLKYPVRTELLVLSADPKMEQPIGLPMFIREGGVVYRIVGDQVIRESLQRQEDLEPGVTVLAPMILGSVQAEVERDEEGSLYWRAGTTCGNLVFDADDRHCWTSSAAKSG